MTVLSQACYQIMHRMPFAGRHAAGVLAQRSHGALHLPSTARQCRYSLTHKSVLTSCDVTFVISFLQPALWVCITPSCAFYHQLQCWH